MPFNKNSTRRRVQSTANIGGRTKQSFQFDADPNTLMKQFTKTGDENILKRTSAIAMHGDFSEIPDFFTALLQVQEVEEEFAALPSNIRNHCDNDASKFIALIADPARVDECIELGLVEDSTTRPKEVPLPSTTGLDPETPQPETPPEG